MMPTTYRAHESFTVTVILIWYEHNTHIQFNLLSPTGQTECQHRLWVPGLLFHNKRTLRHMENRLLSECCTGWQIKADSYEEMTSWVCKETCDVRWCLCLLYSTYLYLCLLYLLFTAQEDYRCCQRKMMSLLPCFSTFPLMNWLLCSFYLRVDYCQGKRNACILDSLLDKEWYTKVFTLLNHVSHVGLCMKGK